MSSPSRVDGGVQVGDFDGTGHNDTVHDTPIGTLIPGGKDHGGKAGHEVNSAIESSPISVSAPIVSGFYTGAPRCEEVTQLVKHYFVEGDIGVIFDQSIVRPVLPETQSESVDGTKEVTKEWMVPDQLRA